MTEIICWFKIISNKHFRTIYQDLLAKKKRLSVIGLGYVGLPIALEFAKYFSVISFDINTDKIALMQQGIDPSKELDPSAFEGIDIHFTDDPTDLKEAHFHIIGVPTDIDEYQVPNLRPLMKASASVGRALKKGDYVVYESTVYPGCTEENCIPILEAESGLKIGDDFKIGYSPERINPGDRTHTLTKVTKVISGSDPEASAIIAEVYGHIIEAGIYRASSIKVAEAAKVIENTQRDINIALMNELAMIFERMGIDTNEVLETAGTKWNFLKFSPGLVGGHCIGIDPYYLAYKAKELGFIPQMILSGRRTNEEVSSFIAKRLVKSLIEKGKNPSQSKVLVKGITFKEDVADTRNSKVKDLIQELLEYSLNVHVLDPYISPNEVAHEFKLPLINTPADNYDAVVVAVAHRDYKKLNLEYYKSIMTDNPILFDIKGIYPREAEGIEIWRL